MLRLHVFKGIVSAACGAAALFSCPGSSAAARGVSQDWPSIHGDLANQRYVALDQINRNTIAQLGATWASEPFADGATSRMTPLVHDRLMFFAAGARVYALDATSGKVVWVHQTENRKLTGGARGGEKVALAQSEGLAMTRSWGLGLGGGMVFVGLMNGHVAALREKSGDVVWDELISNAPLAVAKGVTSTPLYVDGVLYFGIGMEYSRGHVVAVDAKSGSVLWRTPTIPDPGQPGHETWPGDSEIWRSGGAGLWAAGAADPTLGLVYFGTSNPGPSFGGQVRAGDNLYSASLLALEMKTGKIRWYHQLVHHDLWESDVSVPPVLFDQRVDGRLRRGVAVMRADGYLFLFDRGSGEPLVPIEERPVPQNAELLTAATQPFPQDANTILPPCDSWKSKIPAGFVLGCMFDPPSHDVRNRLMPWSSVRIAPMSYSRQTGFFYAQGANSLMWQYPADDPYFASNNVNGDRVPDYPPMTIAVAALDSRTDKAVWRRELPTLDDSGYRAGGGALSTAGGLVFRQGGDGTLQAFDANTGRTVWKFQTDFAGGDASPMSYAIDGKQYVSLIAGTKVWAFSLGGKLPQAASIALPPPSEVTGPIHDTDEIETLTLEQIPANGRRYHLNEYAFNPYRARVPAGTTVKFINNGYKPHTIVARDGSWTTGLLGPTQVATVTFEKPGNYLYFSKEYPWSYGEVIVVSRGGSAAPGANGNPGLSDQVSLGKTQFAASCAPCHGNDLHGRDPAPALTGRGFAGRWAGRDALAFFDRVRTTMPPTAPGSLSDENYAAIVAYILHSNDSSAPAVLDRETMKGLAVTATR